VFAKILVDISHADVDRLFTYAIPDDMAVEVGMHVLVPFGKGNSAKEGFVISVTDDDLEMQTKPVLKTIEPFPVLLQDQIDLAIWMQKSYNCTLIDALRLMIPAQLRGGRIHEQIERTVMLAEGLDLSAAEASFFDKKGNVKAAKQYEIFCLLKESHLEISRKDINAFIPNAGAAISALIKRGYVVEDGHVTFRRPTTTKASSEIIPEPTNAQKSAIESISTSISANESKTFLLHGVTGSGKTEVYLRCIEACLKQNKQSIILVPEISLTPQTVSRFQMRFGDEIAVLHSRLSAGERFDEWRRIRLGQAKVVVGARSAVFAPLSNLGLMLNVGLPDKI